MKAVTRTTLALFALSFTGSLSAQVLMLDWGTTTVASDDLTNSPYHSVNGSFTDTTWIKMGQGDPTLSSIKWADGTAANDGDAGTQTPGEISLNFGTNVSAGQTIIDLTKGATGNVSGTQINTDIYAGTSVGRDGTYIGSAAQQRAVGLQIGGLAVGTYDVYIVGRNTDTTFAHVQNFYVGTSAAAGNFNFNTYSTESVSYAAGTTDNTSDWTFDAGNAAISNYVRLTVSITAENPYLNLASIGGTSGDEMRGFLNAVQIVSVIPEPSTYALLAGAGGLVLACARRRSRGL